MTLAQKWVMALVGLTAFGMALANPNGVYKGAQAIRNVTAGSLTDIAASGRGKTGYAGRA